MTEAEGEGGSPKGTSASETAPEGPGRDFLTQKVGLPEVSQLGKHGTSSQNNFP